MTGLSGKLYSIPGGAVGRRYVDHLTLEMSHFSVGNYPSKRLIVFSTLMLQIDCMVRKGFDVRSVIERRLAQSWDKGEFDLLVHEAERCDKSLKKTISSIMMSLSSRLF